MLKRDYSLDLLRIFCCYCIIVLHVSGHLVQDSNFWCFIQGIVRPALWCFMSLSGYFILSKPITNWKTFYFRHFTNLVIPLVIYTFIYQLYNSHGQSISILEIISGDSIGHLWFIYTLLSLYILAPFLQTMLQNLDNHKFSFLLFTMFILGRASNLLSSFNATIGIPTTILGNCSLFFFLFGYWLWKNSYKLHHKIVISIGTINIFYSAYTFTNSILSKGAATLSLGMIIGVIFYFVLFNNCFGNIKSYHLQRIIVFFSERTYGIYLIHILIFQIFTDNNFLNLDPYSTQHFWMLPLKSLIIFIVGLLISICLDFLICIPLRKLVISIMRKFRSNTASE